MTKKDISTKKQYINDIDKMYSKYLDKTMEAPFDSWAFKGAKLVKLRMHELKRELEKLTITD
jgi:hypothetical protein